MGAGSGLLRYGSCVLVPWGGYVALAWTGAARLVAAPREELLRAWEGRLLGGLTAPELLAAWMRPPALRALLVATYLSFYAVLLATPAWLLWRGRHGVFDRLRGRLALAGLLGYALYFLVPARSPYYVLALYERPEFRFSQGLVHRALEGRVAFLYDAFPSMHIAFAALIVHTAADRETAVPGVLWLGLLVLATLATGAHWGLDAAAGLALAALVAGVLNLVERPRRSRP